MGLTKWKMNGRLEPTYALLLLPALAIYGLFFIYPALSTFVYSFTNWSDINPRDVEFVGWKNYKAIFREEIYMTGIRNTLVYALISTLLINALAIPLAVALNRGFKTRALLRSVFFLPAVFSPLIIGFLWSYLYSTSDFGLINQGLAAIGIGKINFLGDADLALYAVIFTQVWQWAGYNMVIYLANLQSINPEYYEAAQLDGAGPLQSFRSITLPLLAPAITFCTVTVMISGLKVFDIIYSLTSGGPGHATETIVSLMVKKGLGEGFYAFGSAFGILFVGIVGLITYLQLRLVRLWGER
ncbi:sugar ABC transporter permease [Paenibacillus agaridevorans]|uniref:Sugar ABC transporter permease n=1 Tax=Paenibacillus agaridevorans TaxID=171404 RepID=A0A2R5F3P9_9BACL|nr:sugar ABC transporter permease [Paenibacillus agaridevorans]GBG11103.1 sugar ABC transporter permease [Paenibacillus agaridevorans]